MISAFTWEHSRIRFSRKDHRYTEKAGSRTEMNTWFRTVHRTAQESGAAAKFKAVVNQSAWYTYTRDQQSFGDLLAPFKEVYRVLEFKLLTALTVRGYGYWGYRLQYRRGFDTFLFIVAESP